MQPNIPGEIQLKTDKKYSVWWRGLGKIHGIEAPRVNADSE